jgi:DNA-binding CsgD family transcriptional regulator
MSQFLVDIFDILPHLPGFAFCKDKDITFVGCNENFAMATGFESAKKTVGKKDNDVNAFSMKDDFQHVLNADKRILEGGEPIIGIHETHEYPNKQCISVVTNKYPLLNQHAEVVGLFGIYVPTKQAATSHEPLSLIHEVMSKNTPQNNKIKRYTLETDNGTCHITAREFDCIKELLQGKTAKAIGRTLNITHRTVESHILHVKQKLNCHFKSELIDYLLKKTNFFSLLQTEHQKSPSPCEAMKNPVTSPLSSPGRLEFGQQTSPCSR